MKLRTIYLIITAIVAGIIGVLGAHLNWNPWTTAFFIVLEAMILKFIYLLSANRKIMMTKQYWIDNFKITNITMGILFVLILIGMLLFPKFKLGTEQIYYLLGIYILGLVLPTNEQNSSDKKTSE